MSFTRFRPSTAIAAGAMGLLAACGTDNASGPLANTGNNVSLQVLGSSAAYIVPGTPAGTFDMFKADGAGRQSGAEFWDNSSDDGAYDEASKKGCSIGFYATSSMLTTCKFETDGSFENSVGNDYQYMWNDKKVLPAAFSFNSGTTFKVTFQGSYSEGVSVAGYYIKTGSTYDFEAVDSWSDKTLPSAPVSITAPAGSTWGFFIANNRAGVEGVEASRCGTIKDKNGVTLNVACSDATGGFVENPFQQFALFGNENGTKYLVGAEDKTVRFQQDPYINNDSDYNDFIWAVVPQQCDFMTFGRTQIASEFGSIVISGNVGGANADGTIKGTFNIQVGGVNYMVQDITSYGPIGDAPMNGLTNSRIFSGTSRHKESVGAKVEVRMYDGGEPGRTGDRVNLVIDGKVILSDVLLDRGNIQYHANCRGPKD